MNESEAVTKNKIAPAPLGLSPLFWLAALLPLVGYLGSIGLAEAKRWGAPSIQIAIEGYDPRDPVRGHYLQYRVTADSSQANYWTQACAGAPVNGVSPVYVFRPGEPEPECVHPLPADFVRESHRYYVQQDKGRSIEQAVRERGATIEIKLISSKSVMVEQLLVDGQPVGPARSE